MKSMLLHLVPVALPPALANLAGQLGGQQIQESDLFLGSAAFTKNESENLGIIYKWLDDIMPSSCGLRPGICPHRGRWPMRS